MWFPEEHYTIESTVNYLITKEQLKQLTSEEINDIVLDLHSNGSINLSNDPDYITYEEFRGNIKNRIK